MRVSMTNCMLHRHGHRRRHIHGRQLLLAHMTCLQLRHLWEHLYPVFQMSMNVCWGLTTVIWAAIDMWSVWTLKVVSAVNVRVATAEVRMVNVRTSMSATRRMPTTVIPTPSAVTQTAATLVNVSPVTKEAEKYAWVCTSGWGHPSGESELCLASRNTVILFFSYKTQWFLPKVRVISLYLNSHKMCQSSSFLIRRKNRLYLLHWLSCVVYLTESNGVAVKPPENNRTFGGK